MRTPKIYSAGCSFTDYLRGNNTVYGCELAKLMNWEYLHQGAGAGSNWRIWRVIGGLVKSGEITSRDIVTVQYTGLERREFWTRYKGNPYNSSGTLAKTAREPVYDGELIRYKAWAWQWQDNLEENEFFKTYEEDHVCLEYELEWFRLQHYQFQLLLQHHNIRCVFLQGRHIPVDQLELIEPFDRWAFRQPLEFQIDESTWHNPEDNSHLCDHGHTVLGKMLFEHIQANVL